MPSLPKRIMERASVLPEATPICPATLLHLGKRAAVDQALARLAHAGRLMRICQGVYMCPIETRFGLRTPRIGTAIEALSALCCVTDLGSRRTETPGSGVLTERG